ncbi:Aste57867_12038 [Aphanomyces stellatus]|uniref:Aste57867_12038 protein n=1 Tax=Aphanomyces stellatus TaxID=120398 RepID=A0A485KVB5_9STRA|nr:hypothetical protein As57867_011993 [Aphanomyces stellatus]VFT88893.1 Aste57867_12038 [Aphanomyces stellatus]
MAHQFYGNYDLTQPTKRKADLETSSDTPDGKAGGKWTAAEDEALRLAVERNGNENWKAIADIVKTRNHSQCLQRWNKVLKPGLIKGNWSPEEDALLREQIDLHGEDAWVKVAEGVSGRTTKQCRERWRNHLAPSINRSPFSQAELALLDFVYNKIGNRWTLVAKLLPGRAEDDIKKKWRQLHPKQEKKKAGRLPKLELTELLNSIKYEISSGRLPRMDWIYTLTLDNNEDFMGDFDDEEDKESLQDVPVNQSMASLPAATAAPPAFVPPFLTKKKKQEWDQMSIDILTNFLFSASFKNQLQINDIDDETHANTRSNLILSMDDDPVVSRVIDSFRAAGSSKDIQSLLDDLDNDEYTHLMDVATANHHPTTVYEC